MLEVSFIIVSFNAKELLASCVQSILSCTPSLAIEIIVVDNASTDGSVDLIRELFPQVKLIVNNKNFGFAKANNIGIRVSNGRYICFVNSDIVLQDNCIDLMCDYMEANKSVGMLGPKLLNPDKTLQYSCRKIPTLWNAFCNALGLDRLFPSLEFCNHDSVGTVAAIVGAFWMIRREAIEQVGLLDESFFFYGEDIDWCKRFIDAGWDIVYFPEAKAIHHIGGSSKTDPIKQSLLQISSRLIYWRKHHTWASVIVFKIFFIFHEIIGLFLNSIIYFLKKANRKTIFIKILKNYKCIIYIIGLSKKNNNK